MHRTLASGKADFIICKGSDVVCSRFAVSFMGLMRPSFLLLLIDISVWTTGDSRLVTVIVTKPVFGSID